MARGTVQLANEALLAPEQFSVGGVYSVRGYRENQLVRDKGYLGSLELHLPVLQGRRQGNLLTVVPFFDVGGGWNNELTNSFNGSDSAHETITSAGVGVLIEPADWLRAQAFWGHAFTDFAAPEHSLQDSGFHFSVSVGRH